MPRLLKFAILVLVFLSFIPLALIARARSITSEKTRIQLVQDMGNQPKFKPQSENPLFADGRAERPEIRGTVMHGAPVPDPVVETGRDGAGWVRAMPAGIVVDEPMVRRGQERFGIYCSPCHGLAGYGDGLVARRADQLQEGTWVPPTNLNTDQVRARPNGHIFNTITNGIRSMPSYASQIAVADRWAIVAYVRALERSQNAKPGDLPADRRAALGGR